MKIGYEDPDVKYLDEVLEIVVRAYREERKDVPCLPVEDNLRDKLRQHLEKLLEGGSGVMITGEDGLRGFMVGIKNRELFGKYDGIYCPIYGHGALGNNIKGLYGELYGQAAHKWVEEGSITHAVALFAHDVDLIDTWFWLGFGLRCVDSIKEVSPAGIDIPTTIRKALKVDLSVLADLHRQHNLYYRKSPTFMPNQDEDPVLDLRNWLKKEDRHIWIAYKHDDLIGYVRIQPTAESFVSEYREVMNITAAYVKDDYRNSGVARNLLETVECWLKDNGYTLCGVDFESINPLGSAFWNRNFTPYSFTLVRRVDDRILSLKTS